VGKFLTSRYRLILAVVLGLIVVYALVGFLLAPKLLRSALLEQIPKTLNLTPSVGEIRINPFLLRLEMKDFSLAEKGGDRLLGFDRLFVEVRFASLWHRALMFKDIQLDAPFVNAVVGADGALNLLKLQPQTPPPPPEEKPQPLPRIQIDDFKVSRGALSYDDRSREPHFEKRLEPISFDLSDFTTQASGGTFSLTAATKAGERFEWKGSLAVQPVASEGELRVIGLHARTIWEYIDEQVAFSIDGGSIDVDAHYRFALRDAVDLQLDLSKFAVTDLAISPKSAGAATPPAAGVAAAVGAGAPPVVNGDSEWVVLPHLELAGLSLDLVKRQVQIESLDLTQLKLLTWLEADGSLNLQKLAASPAPPAPAAGATVATVPSAPAAATAKPAPAPWQVSLREFSLHDADISVEDRSIKPTARFLLTPLSLQVNGASSDLSRPVQIKFDTTVNATGDVDVSGEVTPQPLTASLDLKVAKFDLKAIQPYVAQQTAMTLLGGRLGTTAKIHYGPGKPVLQFAGNVSVQNLHTVDDALRDDFVNWQALDLQGLKYQQGPDRLSIDRIAIVKPYARVIIEPDTSLNASRILAGPKGLPPPATAGTTAAAAAPESASAKPKAAVAKGKAKTVAQAPKSSPSMPIAIRSIDIQAGELNFADLSVQPNFAAGIQKLHGTIQGLSSDASSRAKIDLHGEVDPFAPVEITGEVNVLGPALYTDIAMSFRNIELSVFNPYSGKFAGYSISKGKLTTELNYKVVGRKLDATHHIIVDQLEFGDKTASKDAVSLPVKLAVALLKDRNGVIDLNFPVGGSLDDPKFKIGPVIWQVVKNLLVKAVTAPFRLLGALFGGGPDLQFVDFRAGAAVLDPVSTEKIKVMTKALTERPQLKLEIPIAALAEIDRPALIEARFAAELQEAADNMGGHAATKSAAKSVAQPAAKDASVAGAEVAAAAQAPAPAFVPAPDAASVLAPLDPAAQLKLLTSLYTQHLGHAPQFPPPPADAPAAKADVMTRNIDFLKSELKSGIVIDDSQLTALGEQRAIAIQQLLLTGTGIDPARVFLVANNKIKLQDGMARLELSLQ
jgi:hypothetical protein